MEPDTPRRINKYEVLDLIGRGGMGVVYKAVDRSLDRLVAIKMVTSAGDVQGDLLKRFYRESQFTANLRHQNIVTVYELGDFEGRPYLVMEYLAGQSLDSMISRQPMTLQQRINYIRQVCNGLHYAHSRQPSIIHRDVKPANVVILEDGTAKIVDFGIARLGQSNDTRSGMLMGSYHYMSPEQIENAELDGRSDIFSAGVVLYQLLTLTLPFEGNGVAQTLHRIVNSPPPPLGQFLKEYPATLEEIISRALAKNRDERYQTAEEFAFDLMQVESELSRTLFGAHIERAEELMRQGEFETAKLELIRVLDADSHHARANDLMREVQQAIMRLQRKRRARDLRTHAQDLLQRNQVDAALGFLDQAVTLDNTDTDLRGFRDHVRDMQVHSQKLSEILDRAEKFCTSHDLDGAARAVAEAIEFDPESARARSFKLIVDAKLLEREKRKEVQELLTSARHAIGEGQFASALESLRKAGELDPTVSGLRDLISMAETGQSQSERRMALQKATAEVKEAFDHQNFERAGTLVDAALGKFTGDTLLLELKTSIERELEAQKREMAPAIHLVPNPPKREAPPPPVPDYSTNVRSAQAALRKPRPHENTVAELTPIQGIEFPAATNQGQEVQPGALHSGTAAGLPHEPPLRTDAALPGAGMLATGSVSDQKLAGVTPDAKLWQPDVLQAVEKQLATFIGPLARVVVKRAAAATTDTDEFYRTVAASITTPRDREAFLASRGRARRSSSATDAPVSEPKPTGGSRQELTPQAIDRAARLLAPYMGPLAAVLTKKAAQQAESLHGLYLLLARHIDRESERAKFLRDAGYPGR